LLNYCWEHIFCFIKKPTTTSLPLARTKVGVPFTDKSNMSRGNRGKNGDLHCGGDIWWLPYETTGPSLKKEHRHGFPLELPKRVIKLSGIPKGSLVFDPFMGGGTTAIAARELGMMACGYDKSEFIAATAIKEFEGYKKP
jgi:site-specific DNA-methyltransferase (adenine-specific)